MERYDQYIGRKGRPLYIRRFTAPSSDNDTSQMTISSTLPSIYPPIFRRDWKNMAPSFGCERIGNAASLPCPGKKWLGRFAVSPDLNPVRPRVVGAS